MKNYFKIKPVYYAVYILFCLMLGEAANAQKLTILDENTLLPVSQARVTLLPGGQQWMTNEDGQIDIADLSKYTEVLIEHVYYNKSINLVSRIIELNYHIHLSPVSYKMDEIIISSGKIETKRSDLTIQSLLVNKSEIEFLNPSTTADLMQSTGDVFVQKSQQGGGSPVLRGFEANKILLVLDGVRMNNAIFRGGHLQNIITVDPYSLEKIEVLYGPSSVIYGSDALGGVIHLFTKKPMYSLDSNFKVSGDGMIKYASANDEKAAHIGLNFGFKKWASNIHLNISDFGDLRQGGCRNPFYGDWGKTLLIAERVSGVDTAIQNKNPNIQTPSSYKQFGMFQKLSWKPTEEIEHLFSYQFSTSTNIPRYDRLSELNSNGTLKNAEWYYGPQKFFLTNYLLDLNKETKYFDDSKFNIAFQSIEESRHNRNFKSNKLNHRIEKVNILSINLDFYKTVGPHEILFGMEGNSNYVKSTAYAEDISTLLHSKINSRYPSGGSSMANLAIYIAHHWKPGEKFNTEAGLRYSYNYLKANFKDTLFLPFLFQEITQKNLSLNGRIGVRYKCSNQLNFNANIATGFRVPNIDDLAKVFEVIPGSVILPNPNLRPENLVNLDIGMKINLKNKYEFSIAAFYTWYQNIITLMGSKFNGMDSVFYNDRWNRIVSQSNADKAYLYGANIKLSMRFNEEWAFENVINYTFGRIKTDISDDPLDHIPPAFGKTSLIWKSKNWNIESALIYQGWKHLKDYNIVGEDNIQYASIYGSPAWCTLNFSLQYHLTQNLQIQGALENVLDSYYRVFSSGFSAAGRNAIFSIRYKL